MPRPKQLVIALLVIEFLVGFASNEVSAQRYTDVHSFNLVPLRHVTSTIPRFSPKAETVICTALVGGEELHKTEPSSKITPSGTATTLAGTEMRRSPTDVGPTAVSRSAVTGTSMERITRVGNMATATCSRSRPQEP